MRFIFAVLFWVLFAYLRGLVIAICVASVAEECRKTCIKHLCISARLLTEIIEAILCRFRPPRSMRPARRPFCLSVKSINGSVVLDNLVYGIIVWVPLGSL